MGARGDLRHHAAVGLVRAVLADDRLGEDPPVAGDQRRRAVVARGFEAEDQGHFASGPLPDTRLRCTRGGPCTGFTLGTRGSPLALAQARKVAAAIEAAQRWPDG